MIQKLLKNKTESTAIQFFRYTLVGGTAFIVDIYSLFAFTEFFHIHYLISAALAFLLGAIVNYILSIFWVFNKRKINDKYFEFGIFVLIGLAGLGLIEVSIWFLTEHMHFHYLLSKMIASAMIYIFNFFGRKILLF